MAKKRKRRTTPARANPTRPGGAPRRAIAFRLRVDLIDRVDAAAERANVNRTYKVEQLLNVGLDQEPALAAPQEASHEPDLFA